MFLPKATLFRVRSVLGQQPALQTQALDKLIDNESFKRLASLGKTSGLLTVRISDLLFGVDIVKCVELARALTASLSSEGDMSDLQIPYEGAVTVSRFGADVASASLTTSAYSTLFHELRDVTQPLLEATECLPGVLAIIGGRGAGKTTHLRSAVGPDVIIRFGEPYEDIDFSDEVGFAVNVADVLVGVTVCSLAGMTVAVDSLRTLVYETDGAAAKGGVIPAFFTALTNVNNYAAALGIVLPININPMVSGADSLDAIVDLAASSVAGVRVLEQGKLIGAEYRNSDGRSFGALRNVNDHDYDLARDLTPPELDIKGAARNQFGLGLTPTPERADSAPTGRVASTFNLSIGSNS